MEASSQLHPPATLPVGRTLIHVGGWVGLRAHLFFFFLKNREVLAPAICKSFKCIVSLLVLYRTVETLLWVLWLAHFLVCWRHRISVILWCRVSSSQSFNCQQMTTDYLDTTPFHCESIGLTVCQYIYIQGVPGGMDKTSGECSLCWTIPI